MSDKYNDVIRAFWRRIEPFKNKYSKELPKEMPIEFVAHFNTAMSALDLSSDIEFKKKINSIDYVIFTDNCVCGNIIKYAGKFIAKGLYGSDLNGNDLIAIGNKLNELNGVSDA